MVVYKQIMKNSFRAFIPKFTIITVTYFGYHLTQILLFASCLHQSPKPTTSKIIIRQTNDTTQCTFTLLNTLYSLGFF